MTFVHLYNIYIFVARLKLEIKLNVIAFLAHL